MRAFHCSLMRRSALRGAAVGTLVAGLVGIAVPAMAHSGDPTDLQHAQQDLAGTPMSQIEATSRANARKIATATGATPGRRTAATTSSRVERAASAAADDPGVGGKWSAVLPTPVVPTFEAVLPSGRVLMWDSVGDNPAESYPEAQQVFTRAAVWDPQTNTSRRVDVIGYNIFCAGFTQLADGNVLVAGGNKDQALNGIVQTHVFDWRTETWSRGPDMASGRWYPSVTALPNGEASIIGGGPATAEVYQTDNTLRRLLGFTSYSDRAYPFVMTRPDGRLQLLGPVRQMSTMTTAGVGALAATQTRDGINRSYGSFATYAVGKTLVAGGGSVTEDGQTQVPTRTAVVVDTNRGTTTSTPAAPMAVGRRQFNLTVLADGSVLATGGEKKAVDGLVDLDNPVFAAERWDPATGAWTTLASASRVRQYHSTATLLPDGRVLTGGGGICGVCATKGYLEKNAEYFSPPYLFAKDGSGRAATRPVITSAPSIVRTDSTFTLLTAGSARIAKVGLVRLGAPTHGDDQGQRYVPLTITSSRVGTTRVRAPANPAVAPPGYYLLFAVDQAGVPSVAATVQVIRNERRAGSEPSGRPAPAPVTPTPPRPRTGLR